MNFAAVFTQVTVLFLILLVGFFARLKDILNKETNRGFADFLFNITIPFNIISAFNQDYKTNILYVVT